MIQDAARALLDARKNGTLVEPEILAGIATLADAYEVQKTQLQLSGETVAGWKIGATALAAQEILGIGHPILGPVSASTVFQSGVDVKIRPNEALFIETEFAVTLGSDLPARVTPYSRDEVASTISDIHACFELVGCRLASGLKGAGHMIVADHGVNAGVVLGGEISRDHWNRLGEIPVDLDKNGARVASGTCGATIWDHLFDAVAWVANQQGNVARRLQAGDLILTGTCTGLLPLAPGDIFRATFGDIAQVEVELTAG